MECGDLNDLPSIHLRLLNTWFPVGDTVWGKLGGALLGSGLEVSKPSTIPSQLSQLPAEAASCFLLSDWATQLPPSRQQNLFM